MSAAPSNLTWEEWSSLFLDTENPVIHGLDKCSIPEFWKGNALVWSHCPANPSSPVAGIRPGHQIVSNMDEVYSVGGATKETSPSSPESLKVHKLIEENYTGECSWEEMPSRPSSVCNEREILSQRYGHCCCYYNGRILVYGGRNASMDPVFGSEGNLSSYDIATGEWSDVPTLVDNCDYPLPRYGHAVTVNDDNMILYIHGGHVKYAARRWAWGFTSELLALHLETMTWSVQSPHFSRHPTNNNADDAVIGKPVNYLMLHRDFHTAAHINNKIILFGGRTPETKVYSESEFFEFNLTSKKWRCIRPTGYSPGPRNHLIAKTIGHFVIYFGGEATYQWDRSYLSDLFVLNTETYHCSQITAKGSIPTGRCNMAACIRNGDLIISGGETESGEKRHGHPSETTKFSHDLYILPLLPTLQALCIDIVLRNKLNISHLPPRLRHAILRVSTDD